MAGNWDELIQQIKERLDIVEVVSEQVVLKKRGNNYWGLCPFHKDKNPSFCVTPHMGIYKCFSCTQCCICHSIEYRSVNNVIALKLAHF